MIHTFMLLEEHFDAGLAVVTNPAGTARIRTEMELSRSQDNIPISCVGHHVEQHLDSITVLIDSCGGWKYELTGN